jgi:Glyoxalase-like domain
MTSRFTELAVDCHDPERLAAFWCAVLDFQVIDRNEELVEIASWEPTPAQVRERQMPPTMLFIRVPEGKAVKNRLHVDVSPIDRTRAEEVERLIDLGARRVDIGQGEQKWDVLSDPEGNEFCVLRSLAVDQIG